MLVGLAHSGDCQTPVALPHGLACAEPHGHVLSPQSLSEPKEAAPKPAEVPCHKHPHVAMTCLHSSRHPTRSARAVPLRRPPVSRTCHGVWVGARNKISTQVASQQSHTIDTLPSNERCSPCSHPALIPQHGKGKPLPRPANHAIT